MSSHFKKLIRNESGATAIEYGLIAVLISVVIIGAITVIGSELNTGFTTISGKLQGANTPATSSSSSSSSSSSN